MSSDCTRTRSRWILPLILGLAALFRLQGLDLMEYKADEAAASDLARRVARLQSLPRCGLGSGVGVRNPPAFIYLLALPSALTCHPIALTACIALLNVAAVAVCFPLVFWLVPSCQWCECQNSPMGISERPRFFSASIGTTIGQHGPPPSGWMPSPRAWASSAKRA